MADPAADRAGGAVRAVAFALAAALALALTVYPAAAVGAAGKPSHAFLALLAWGIAAGFVHGVGFTPTPRLLRLALGPWAALGLMLPGAFVLARNALA